LQALLAANSIANLNALLVLKSEAIIALGNLLLLVNQAKLTDQYLPFVNPTLIQTILELVNFRRAPVTENCYWYLNTLFQIDKSF
jgi:hypothetical protein